MTRGATGPAMWARDGATWLKVGETNPRGSDSPGQRRQGPRTPATAYAPGRFKPSAYVGSAGCVARDRFCPVPHWPAPPAIGCCDCSARHEPDSESMGAEGIEHPANPSGNSGVHEPRGNKNGNTSAAGEPKAAPAPAAGDAPSPPPTPEPPADPELAAVVAAWPTLAPAMRAAVLALVNAATPPAAP